MENLQTTIQVLTKKIAQNWNINSQNHAAKYAWDSPNHTTTKQLGGLETPIEEPVLVNSTTLNPVAKNRKNHNNYRLYEVKLNWLYIRHIRLTPGHLMTRNVY